MNNDLISRSELKKALEEDMKCGGVKINEFDKGYDLGIKTAIEMLDNATKVKTYCYFCGQTEHGQIEERPQGEWVEKHSDYGVYYQCSICHKMPPNYECDYKEGAIKTNFCPNCGADMRTKENESI